MEITINNINMELTIISINKEIKINNINMEITKININKDIAIKIYTWK